MENDGAPRPRTKSTLPSSSPRCDQGHGQVTVHTGGTQLRGGARGGRDADEVVVAQPAQQHRLALPEDVPVEQRLMRLLGVRVDLAHRSRLQAGELLDGAQRRGPHLRDAGFGFREPSSPRRTLSRMSTAAPSAKRGTVNSASSCAVRSRSRVVPMRELAEFSQASRLRVVNRSGGRTPLPRRNRTFLPAEGRPAVPRPGRRRLPLPAFTLVPPDGTRRLLVPSVHRKRLGHLRAPLIGSPVQGLCPGIRSWLNCSRIRLPRRGDGQS